MDPSPDHLERELAEIKAELARLANRVYALDLERQRSRPISPAPEPHHPPTEPPGHPRVPDADPAVRRRALAHLTAPRAAHSPAEAWSIERLIGGKAFAAAGALIVVLGVGFFLKLAIDEGWLHRIAPATRCWLAAGFGAGLIALGELARKRINVLASAGLSSAGVATIYAAVYAAREVFGLVDAPGAMVLLAGVTGGGIALGVVGRRVFLSCISLVGAYIAPLLLATEEPSPVFLPAYLVALLALGLVLGGWMGGRFHVLRSLAWWGTVGLGSLWVGGWAMDEAPVNGLAFIGVVWVLTHAELVASARFFRRAAGAPEFESEGNHPMAQRLHWAHTRWLVSSFGVTTWTVAFGIALVRMLNREADWAAPAALGGAMAVLIALLAPPGWTVGSAPRTPRTQLATALAAQFGAMVIATIALGLTGWSQAMAWMSLGTAAVTAGERFGGAGGRGVRAFGLVLLVIGTARIGILDWAPAAVDLRLSPPDPVWFERWGLVFGAMGAQVLAAGIAWFVTAAVVRRRTLDAVIMAAVAVVCAMASVVTHGAEAGSIALVWAGVGLLVALLSRTACVPRLGAVAALPAIAAWGPWMLAHADIADWIRERSAAGLSSGLVHAAVIAACGLIGSALHRRDAGSRAARILVVGVTAIMGLVATSYEAHRLTDLWVPDDRTARWAAVSIWWAVVGLATLAVGSMRRAAPARWAGLGLLAAAAGKLVLLDLSEITMVWRVVASMVIGLILLGVAVGYARAMRGKRGPAVE